VGLSDGNWSPLLRGVMPQPSLRLRFCRLALVPVELLLKVGLSIRRFGKRGQGHLELLAAMFADSNGGSATQPLMTLSVRFGMGV
jgi:hypothetical protein